MTFCICFVSSDVFPEVFRLFFLRPEGFFRGPLKEVPDGRLIGPLDRTSLARTSDEILFTSRMGRNVERSFLSTLTPAPSAEDGLDGVCASILL